MKKKKDTEDSFFIWTEKSFSESGLPHDSFVLTESTNDIAKQYAQQDPPIMVYLAETQTHGRGRGGHTWISPKAGTSLLVSFSFELSEAPQHLTGPIVGIHLFRAAQGTWPHLPWSLKAPNDLYLEDKKVAGLLVEAVSAGEMHRLIIGLGLNVTSHPAGIPFAGCLADFEKESIDKETWSRFVQLLVSEFSLAAKASASTELKGEVRQDLLAALKAHHLTKELVDVSGDGDLVFSDRTVDWQCL